MTGTIILTTLIIWSVCAYLTYGYVYGYFWHEFPTLQDDPERKAVIRKQARFLAAFGPMGLIAACSDGRYKHGRQTKEQSVEAYNTRTGD